MDKLVAWYVGGLGLIPATSKCFFLWEPLHSDIIRCVVISFYLHHCFLAL